MSEISLSLAKSFCRVDNDELDTLVQAMLDGAESFVGGQCNIGLGQEVVTELVDGGGFRLTVTRNPIVSLTSITDMETEDELSEDDYELRDGIIVRADDCRWDKGINNYQVVYVGGYSAAEEGYEELPGEPIPPAIIMAVLQLVARSFENRGGKVSEGAAGWSAQWQNLWQTEIADSLNAFTRRGV